MRQLSSLVSSLRLHLVGLLRSQSHPSSSFFLPHRQQLYRQTLRTILQPSTSLRLDVEQLSIRMQYVVLALQHSPSHWTCATLTLQLSTPNNGAHTRLIPSPGVVFPQGFPTTRSDRHISPTTKFTSEAQMGGGDPYIHNSTNFLTSSSRAFSSPMTLLSILSLSSQSLSRFLSLTHS